MPPRPALRRRTSDGAASSARLRPRETTRWWHDEDSFALLASTWETEQCKCVKAWLLVGVLAACGGQKAARSAPQQPPLAITIAAPPVATASTDPMLRAVPQQETEGRDDVRLCDFDNGELQRCRSAPYTGSAFVFDQGIWQVCRATAGRITHCFGPFTGLVVAFKPPVYEECMSAYGVLGACHGPFTGSVALQP